MTRSQALSAPARRNAIYQEPTAEEMRNVEEAARRCAQNGSLYPESYQDQKRYEAAVGVYPTMIAVALTKTKTMDAAIDMASDDAMKAADKLLEKLSKPRKR